MSMGAVCSVVVIGVKRETALAFVLARFARLACPRLASSSRVSSSGSEFDWIFLIVAQNCISCLWVQCAVLWSLVSSARQRLLLCWQGLRGWRVLASPPPAEFLPWARSLIGFS